MKVQQEIVPITNEMEQQYGRTQKEAAPPRFLSQIFNTEFCVLPSTKPIPSSQLSDNMKCGTKALFLPSPPNTGCLSQSTIPPERRLPCTITTVYHFISEEGSAFSEVTRQPRAVLMSSSPYFIVPSFPLNTVLSAHEAVVGAPETSGRALEPNLIITN